MRAYPMILAIVLCVGGLVTAIAQTTQPSHQYPLDTCVVGGERLGSMGEPVVKKIDGREVRFCCEGCVGAFEADKATYHKKMDEAIVAAQKETYALTKCAVSGEELGSMGAGVDYVDRGSNQLVRLCCQGCVPMVKKDPEKYVKKVEAAAAAKS